VPDATVSIAEPNKAKGAPISVRQSTLQRWRACDAPSAFAAEAPFIGFVPLDAEASKVVCPCHRALPFLPAHLP
jgi:hypothetical protein